MKTKFVAIHFIVILLLPWAASGQSIFDLRNHLTGFIDAPVSDASGTPLAGPNYLAELWGGVTGDSLAPALAASSRTRVITPFISGGYFNYNPPDDNYATIFSVRPSELAALQVRAWDARLGPTYEEAVAAGLGGYGESPIFSAAGNSPYAEPPEPPAPLFGLQSFSLRPVPEPSTWILLGLGVIGLSWHLRRRV